MSDVERSNITVRKCIVVNIVIRTFAKNGSKGLIVMPFDLAGGDAGGFRKGRSGAGACLAAGAMDAGHFRTADDQWRIVGGA